jgi:lipopolysaccharide transport system permease protein
MRIGPLEMTLATSTQAPSVPAPPPPAAGRKPQKPHLTIKSRRGWIGINLAELWHFRDLLISLTIRDIKLRYKQAVLGIAWVVVQPLIAAAIFSYVFNKLAGMAPDSTIHGREIPAFLYAFNGMVAWTLFATVVTKVSGILLGNSSMVSKVYFPRLLLPLSGATGALVDLGISLVLLLGWQVYYGVPFGLQILAAPLVLLLILSAGLGIGMWAAALCVRYRDVAYIVPVMVQFLLFASPIAWSLSKLGTPLKLNPLAGLLGLWRWSVLQTPFPETWVVVHAICVSLALLFIGAFVFRRMERTFADVI